MRLFIYFFIFCISIKLFADNSIDAKAICEHTKDLQFPAKHKASDDGAKLLKNCDSEDLYYGINQKRDFEKARHCAFLELKSNEQRVFGGSSILMMIYANAYDVERNLDLAEKNACEIEGAPAEISGRLAHLEFLKSKKDQTEVFDLCDDITSGFMIGQCARHIYRVEKVKRQNKLKVLRSAWTGVENNAFVILQKSSEHFSKLRSENEIDLSGSARANFVISELAMQEADFIESIEKLEKKKAPKYSAKQASEEDRKMNLIFKQIDTIKEPSIWGTITPDQISETQKSWINYRDAWIAFAKIKYPNYSSESISAWFTKKRNHMLSSFTK